MPQRLVWGARDSIVPLEQARSYESAARRAGDDVAVVMVDGEEHEGPFYVRQPFTLEPDWAVTSINLDLDQLLARAASPGAAS